MKRFKKRLLSLNDLRKALGFSTAFKALKVKFNVEKISKLPSKVFVIAPHPDDDIFGCGGLMAKVSKNGGIVKVAYLANGDGGVSDQFNDKTCLADLRAEETVKSAKIIGISEQEFCNLKDGCVAPNIQVNDMLKALIKSFKPDIICLPSFFDNHPDHRAANDILVHVLDENSRQEIWAYEVWSPIFANRILDISDVVEIKKKAIAEHKSQLASRNYNKAILGLNSYRAEINSINGFAEGYFASDFSTYKKLFELS